MLDPNHPTRRITLHKLQTARFSSPEELQTPSLEDQKQSSWSRFWDGLGVDLNGFGLVLSRFSGFGKIEKMEKRLRDHQGRSRTSRSPKDRITHKDIVMMASIPQEMVSVALQENKQRAV